MNVTDSEQRRKRILEAIVEAYISTASPVGSAFIARKLRSTLSPATIRNIMMELETHGLLEQPHTSAGRVPTDRGYRVYVDSVMDVPWLSAEQVQAIEARVAFSEMDLAQWLEQVSGVLAELTEEAAFVVAPTVKTSTVRQIELVPLNVRKILCILVANEEMFSSHVVEVEEPMTRDEAAALARFLNTELAGLPVDDLLSSLERRLLAASDSFYYLVKRSLTVLQHALATEPDDRFFLEGASYVVAQPEFRRSPEKAHQLLKGLESHRGLVEQVRDDLKTGHVRVRIGSEVQLPGCTDCSYVAAPFTMGHAVLGGVGVLGPRRMDYRRVSALAAGMARSVSDILARE